ncbi:restriction endonuclease subunit S [Rhodococcus qingshengii]|uniref:restriction endonuclease subunit S n=1 Tax=Rhodococcus qingshengii TaxID=334542 RepID=UPI0009F240FF|nr:restriction endonuclease subunit S [Rhodococcus qingshengii]ORC20131.1 hypothetical protein BXO91_23965 [Rhodococcus qingshengii]
MSSSSIPDWSVMTLQDLIDRKFTGPSPTCEERNIATSEEWGLLKTTAVTWSGWNENAHKVPPRQFWGNSSIEVRQGDVLITKAGPRNRVGVVVHVPATRSHLMVSGKMVGLRPSTSKVIPSLLAGLLSTRHAQDYLNSRTTGMAESQTNFADEALLQTRLNVPPLPEQRKIAEILDTLDDQIHATEQIIAKLRLTQSGLIDDLLNFQAKKNQIEQLGKWLASKPKNGYSPLAVDQWNGVSMLGLGCLSANGFSPSQLKNAPPKDPRLRNALLEDGDLLMTRANTRDLVGFAGVYRDVGHPCTYPDLMMRLKPVPEVSIDYLEILLNSASIRRQVKNLASGTSGSMVKITGKIVENLQVVIPHRNVQIEVVDQINAVKNVCNSEIISLNKLLALKRGLCSDLLTGRVRVPMAASS